MTPVTSVLAAAALPSSRLVLARWGSLPTFGANPSVRTASLSSPLAIEAAAGAGHGGGRHRPAHCSRRFHGRDTTNNLSIPLRPRSQPHRGAWFHQRHVPLRNFDLSFSGIAVVDLEELFAGVHPNAGEKLRVRRGHHTRHRRTNCSVLPFSLIGLQLLAQALHLVLRRLESILVRTQCGSPQLRDRASARILFLTRYGSLALLIPGRQMGKHLARPHSFALMHRHVHDLAAGSCNHRTALGRQNLEWPGWVVPVGQQRGECESNRGAASPYHRPPCPPRWWRRRLRFARIRLVGHERPVQLELLLLALRAHRPEADKPRNEAGHEPEEDNETDSLQVSGQQ